MNKQERSDFRKQIEKEGDFSYQSIPVSRHTREILELCEMIDVQEEEINSLRDKTQKRLSNIQEKKSKQCKENSMKAKKTWRPLGRTENDGILPEVYEWRWIDGSHWYEGTRQGDPQSPRHLYRVPGPESFKVKVVRCGEAADCDYSNLIGDFLDVRNDSVNYNNYYSPEKDISFPKSDCLRVPEIKDGWRLLPYDENGGILPRRYNIFQECSGCWTVGIEPGNKQRIGYIYIVPIAPPKPARDEAHDRLICELIVEKDCAGISCGMDNCPLNPQLDGSIQCADRTGHGASRNAAVAWLAAHPKPAPPIPGLGEGCEEVDEDNCQKVLRIHGDKYTVMVCKGTEVIMSKLKDNQCVCWGDGRTYYFLLTEKETKN